MCLIEPIGSFIAIANLMKDSVIENYPFGDPQGTTSTSAIRDTSSTAAFLGVVQRRWPLLGEGWVKTFSEVLWGEFFSSVVDEYYDNG